MDGSLLLDQDGDAPSSLRTRLDGLAACAPGLAASAYMDLAAGLVLGKATECDAPQEELDALCRRAAQVFALASGDQAVIARGMETIVLQRMGGEDATALCLFFDPETGPAAARDTAKRAAGALAG